MKHTLFSLIRILVILSLMIPGSAASGRQLDVSTRQESVQDSEASLFRTVIQVNNASRRDRLSELAVQVVSETDGRAVVLVNAEQLETLARLGFEPSLTETLNNLVSTSSENQVEHSRLSGLLDSVAAESSSPEESINALIQNLGPQETAALAGAAGTDDDADGLTNTVESWWCTNPLDSDTDDDGDTDGEEIKVLKDWMGNRRAGPPNDSPWPSWPFNETTCPDKDHDSIPNLAERWDLGLDMDLESSDRDKFDDGQEVFGVTNCPGGNFSCGYGDLPRSSDAGYVGATLPSWVKAPGNHPLVAAYPIPEISIINSSITVHTVTQITTDHIIAEGTEVIYLTAETTGQTDSKAKTKTWNDWQENSETTSEVKHTDEPINGHPSSISSAENWKLELVPPETDAYRIAKQQLISDCPNVSRTYGGELGGSLPISLSSSISTSTDPSLTTRICNAKIRDFRRLWGPRAYWDFPDTANQYVEVSERLDFTQTSPDTAGLDSQKLDPDNQANGFSGSVFSYDQFDQQIAEKLYDITVAIAAPRKTTTEAHGKSWGGSLTETHEDYEEETITNGEVLSNQNSWGNATAINTSHAADLWFSYSIGNFGTEYAKEIGDISFNIFIGSDPHPVYTYSIAQDLGGDGKYHNFLPGENHVYTSRHIPINLEQLKSLDVSSTCLLLRQKGEIKQYDAGGRCPGGSIRIVVEDYSYGTDELFYRNAVDHGLQISIDDGYGDGDEAIDTFVLPVFTGDSAQDTISRYFPTELDDNGFLVGIWTPEINAANLVTCLDKKTYSNEGKVSIWCKHTLSTMDWWSIYSSGLGDGSTDLQGTVASQGSKVFIRFNQDSDLDGYSDRSEVRLGSESNNPASFPRPELLGGLHSAQSGSNVIATLSLLNSGLYDAYGVEAVMIAPDDTITITNNTVGGSGRVKAGQSVVVGSRIQPAALGTWTGTAKPASSGYYTGTADRVYSFTVTCDNPGGCEVGSSSWTLTWTDGQGGSGSLPFGTGYASPTPLAVGAFGVKVGMLSGRVYNGNTFTVQANTPRDTFQYTINSEPHTQPVVLVSYNDPQGNHRFILPSNAMSLSSPTADLVPFSGQMRQDPGVELVTLTSFLPGVNTTQLVVNNPTGVTLTDSKLFLEFIDPEGTVVAEVSAEQDFAPGPSVVPVSWDSNTFAPAYNPEQDYIVLAFWTDLQGNILDTAGRPLSSFQQDPKPEFALAAADATWDFGTAAQGTVMRREFTFANTGQLGLLTYVEAPAGLSVSQTGSQGVAPADITRYAIALSTEGLPLGTYDQTLTIHTSDPDQPTQTVRVLGTITAGTADTPVGQVERPLDYTVSVPGPKSQGEWYEFTHDLGPDPQSLHPVKVYSQDYSKLWGVGKYATAFGEAGTASYDMFGDGRDGDLTVSSGQTLVINTIRANVTAMGSTAAVSSSTGFAVGDFVLFNQTQGTANVGRYEFSEISQINGNSWVLKTPLLYEYNNSSGRAQVIKIPRYRNVTIQSGGTLTAPPWDGWTGGIFSIMVQGNLVVNGTIHVVDLGYRGGTSGIYGQNLDYGQQGESLYGTGSLCSSPNSGGGGGGKDRNGGGGSHQFPGDGDYGGSCGDGGPKRGSPGATYGSSDLSKLYFGSGGGAGISGGGGGQAKAGGNGGGIVYIYANALTVTGQINASGGMGYPRTSYGGRSGGGGAGGSIKIVTASANLGTNLVRSIGGAGGLGLEDLSISAPGGAGWIQVSFCNTLTGNTSPAYASTKLDCYVAEQKEVIPYTTSRILLQEGFSGNYIYQVQYGHLFSFITSGAQSSNIRLPGSELISVKSDFLLSGVENGAVNINVDIGNDSIWDWTWAGTISSATTLTSPDLSGAFNAYWATHGAPTSGYLDVPVRVSLDKPGQVLLTNLQVQAAPSKLRTVRVTAGNYSTVSLNYTLGGAAPVTFGIDVGDNGSVDTAFTTNPGALSSPNLATAVNAFLSGKSGSVDVPVRFYVSPAASLSLTGFSAALSGKPDASLANADLHLPGSSPIEGETVTLSATLRNPSSLATGGLTAAFYATAPGWGEWYIGSVLVPNIPPGGTATAALDWNTLGFSGSVPVRVVVDPHDRLGETSESNNQAAGTLAILTRPDLQVAGIQPGDAEPVAGETVTVTFTAKNAGQTAAGSSSWRLYDGDPSAGGTLICSPSLAVGAGGQQPQGCPWTPASPGPHRLFVVGDAAGAVGEYDEGNNQLVKEVYVGFAGPILLDSGSAVQDPAYSASAGFGVVDTGQVDKVSTCSIPAGELPEVSNSRRDPDGEVIYQFDHLLPGHFYHVDLILYECDGAGRQESVFVDDTLLAGPEDLGDTDVHRLSLRLDPALYTDHSVVIKVKAPGSNGAVVAAINLHDVDYRYLDSGSAAEQTYAATPGYGWLDGSMDGNYGSLPYQTLRVDQDDNRLNYRFDGLASSLRYQLHLTFWQPSGTAHIQRIELDGADSGQVVDTGDYQIHRLTVPIPQSAYQSDGSVVVSILRSNASTGPILNEIALEQLTLVQPLSCDSMGVQVTPYFTEAYGTLQFFGQPAPAMETRVLALNPRGQVVGCYVVDTTGQYGLMRLYGEDTSTQPATPGLRAGERVTFQVNGTTAFAQPALYYQNDHAAHPVDLEVKTLAEQSLLLSPGWNLVSFRNEPPSPLVPVLVNPIQSRAARVIGETGIYTPSLADPFVTLKELHALQGYYLLLNGSTSLSWLVAGESKPADTPIALHPGWNWIGGPAQTTPVATALGSITGQYKRVISLTQTYDPSLPPSFSTLKDLKPGAGYLIYATQNTTLTYPAGSGDQAEGAAPASEFDSSACDGLQPTPALSLAYGEIRINGELAPANTRVEFITPNGELAGCAVIKEDGILPLTHLFGSVEDNTPGFLEGEKVTVRINGIPTGFDQLTWSNDRDTHQIGLDVILLPIFIPALSR